MRLAPFADFIKNVVLSTGRPGWLRAATRLELKAQAQDRRKSRRVSFTSSAEVLESRQLLAGPQLVNIAPNTGGFLANGQIRNEAPRELVFTFSPGATIDASTVDAGITVTRAGTDGIVGSGDDIQIPKGYVGVGPLPNQVTLRFADSLVDDQYRVSINGNLQNSLGQAFNNGTTQNTDFRVDFGGQVVSVVPQPVLRASVLTVADASAITDGDRVSVSAGSSAVTFQFHLIGGTGVVAAGNIAINYNLGDSATTLASRLSSAIQSASDDVASPLYKRIFPSASSNQVTLSGAEFSPVVGRTLTNATFLTAADGGLTQAADTVVVYFNQNPLVQALAENPAYYQVFDVATGKMYLPQTVRYDAVGNTAVLQFSADLPQSTFHIQIGAPAVANDTLGNAVNLGTLYVDGGINTVVGFIGDRGGISSDVRDFDLYAFRTGPNGTSGNASVFDFDSSFTNGVRLRLFSANGKQINSTTNSIQFNGLTPNTQYYIGVSGMGNNSYSPISGIASQNGVGTGSYKLQVVLDNSIVQNNDTSSFDTATQLGVLGANGFQVEGEIKAPGNQAYPPMPGGSDEPGHREIPVDGESNDAGTGTTPTIPAGIPRYFYNFQSIYGTDPQGNTLLNGITDTQKLRAREILEIYSRYLGIEFVETDEQGLTIVTGDPRAVDPTIPVGSVGGIAGGGLAIMNGNTDWGASEFGGAWFGVAFHEIGHSLGLAHSYDAPSVMGSGFETPAPPTGGSTPTELVLPGDVNLVAAQRLIPASSTDVNLYQFDLTQNGSINARAVAQQLRDSDGNPAPSLLDPVLSIFSETYVTAKLSSDFGTLNAVKLGFVAKQSGVGGNAIRLVVTKAALGAGVAPQVSVNGTTINIVLNTAGTTAQTLVNTLNANAAASALVTASVDSGVATTNISAPNTTYSPLSLTGGATNRTLVARNDDYFGRDSLVNLHLDKGRYYAAISSTGNTAFNPVVPGTGFGGRTDGIYQLALNFTADPQPSETLNDIRGVALDGDLDNRTGGAFDFWFKTGDTIFVDKANFNDVAPDGTTAHPYSTISQALALAQPGQIVRIVGNGGLDGDAATIDDNRPYLIGFDSQGANAEDGADFIVPQGVTVMIDAGAIIKLKGAIIDVGKTLPNIDRSGAALQVLGTPKQQVQFTSLGNDSIGGRSDSNDFVGPAAGNWGGIVFRQSSDFLGINGKLDGQDFQNKGVFLNSVNQASFSFGGGQVFDDSVLQVFNPVHVENLNSQSLRYARPNIWFNNITASADAAMSADPNSFANTVDRSGPFIRGNKVSGNSVNGMFIRVRTNFGQPIDSLQVPARIDDIDITYVLPENLFIDGGAGGPYLPDPSDITHAGWQARVAGSLVLDPGVILKLSGSRIQMNVGGSQFLAEGTAALPIVMTSLRDDTFGAGGSFDTGSDGTAPVTRGDWAGLFFTANSSGSIDHAIVQYAGGTAAVAGQFDGFNPIAIQQADVRVANTLFENNAGGLASTNRDGLQSNQSATVFVRGAQPVIVNNTFINNGGNVISVNANALNSLEVSDWGRSTGTLSAATQYKNNTGPLVAGNRMLGNETNGMEVRGEGITTETIWDDSDIVHVLRGQVIEDINRHTFGGIRLASGNESSLVVKLDGPNAGFTVTGIPLDINDRIGGTLQVIGSAQYPVIFTSLRDDTAGAGFQPNGLPLLDTNNDGNLSVPTPGDWRSLRLQQLSNDRNAAVALETEVASNSAEQNGTPGTAQFLGSLAPQMASDNVNEKKGGNDYQPYAYEVHGILSAPSDVDVYSFTANKGTEVWFDISRTTSSLDTVLEVIDANGTVLATSNDSQLLDQAGQAIPRPLMKDANVGGDFYTTNPRDAGMRVVLPGSAAVNTYFVRVKSNQGLTAGQYNLQVRIRQLYEAPGSTVRFADIRYATNGVEVLGLPGRSPLTGEGTEIPGNNSFGSATNLGNLLQTDMATLSVSGTLSTASQVDWYQFRMQYDLLQVISGSSDGNKTLAAIFDIDYADGLVRPDAIISVFDSAGRLILVSRDSNITDDQPGPLQNNGLSDMSRGSVGKLDPYIGSVQLPTGNPGATATAGFTYFVAVSSNAQLPQAMNGTFQSGAANGLVRLEPINSVKRIVEDHIGFTGHTTGDPTSGVTATVDPVNTTGLFPINTIAQLQTEVTPWTLRDVTLYGLAGDQLVGINPSTGASLYNAGTTVGGFQGSIKMRSDGVLFGFRGLPGTPNTVGALVRIDPATGATTQIGVDNIPDFNAGTNPADPNQLTSDTVNSFAFVRIGTGNYNLFYAVDDTTGLYNGGVRASRLYQADPASGNANGNVRGEITAAGSNIGTTTGMAEINGTLFGVSSNGFFYSINQGSGTASVIRNFGTPFRSLTEGPKNLNNGAMAGLLFATTAAGNLVCFNTSGVLQPVFAGNASQVPVAAGGIQGISFSPLDWNLWHPTMSRGADAGHGINAAFDESRDFSNASIQPAPAFPPTVTLLPTTNERAGGASFYFGLDGGSPIATTTAQYGVSNDSRNDLLSNPALPNSYNLPGGAFGSLVSNTSFSLATYQAIDKPTLYFNYFLATDGTNSAIGMRDSARVLASTDGGTTWTLLATNNSVRSPAGTATRELPAFTSASKAISAQSNQAVQELFDNTGGWRQARVDLAEYAGQANIRLRFDFSTAGAALAGSQTQGLPGDTFGVGPNNSGRAANNAFEGFYIDDIIVGLAERGEMVTGAVADTNFFAVPTNPDPQAPTQSLVGPYQLEIRRGEQYGTLVSKGNSEITIDRQFDSNDRLTSGFTITAVAGNALLDGQAFTISDGVNTLTFEYDSNSSVLPGRERLAFTNVSTAAQVAQTIRDTINAAAAAGKFVVTATLTDDNITAVNNNGNFKVDLFKATSISGAIAPDVIATVNKTTISEVGSTSAGQATVTVRRTNSTAAALTVNLQAIDPTTGAVSNAITLPASVSIPSGLSSVTFTVSGLNNTLLDFTRSVLIRPTVARYNSVSAPLDVTDDETATLTLSAAGAITEGESAMGTVTISRAPSVPLTIRLNSLDTSELAVPATVTILANQTSATFTINALQDNLRDGNIVTGVVASATGVASGIAPITVVDTNTGSTSIRQTLTVAITPTSLADGGSVGAATVTRTGPTTSPLTVTLTSTNPTFLSVPASVVIPANSASVSFNVTPRNSRLALSREMVLVAATNSNFDTVADFVDITDADVRALSVTLNASSVAEGGTVTGTVTRNSLTTQALVVTLFTTDSSEATVPTTVTILAGQSSATFTVTATADGGEDGTQSVQVGATARGFATGLTALSVQDSPVENGTQYNRMGDTNTVRDQGQIQIYGNAISNVSQFGIVSNNTLRDPVTGLPRPGSAINTPTLNSQRLVPGINISNNLVYNFGQGGINFVGTGAANPTGVVSFGRIVNNTIFGDVVPVGVGISVSNGAGPTVMNNIIANTRTGVAVDASSIGTTVVDASVFKQNIANLSGGVSATNTINLTLLTDPLFVNPLTGNFYLAPGSQAIDSSRNSLSERAGISSVKSPLDIPVSPIIAPANDRFGQLRLDDPAVPNAIGLGANIFIDRGAIERADFSKPKARLTTPLDNGVGVDGDSTLDTVFITAPTDLTQIVLQLTDLGVGIDNATVISSNFIFAQDGIVLVDGVDYQFVYNQNTRQVFFQSISVFPPQNSYTITIPANAVADLAGNTLQPNQSNGTTVFTIIGNAAPVLTQITPLAGLKNINQVITFAQLVAASDLKVVTAHDLTKAFRIETISAGTLVIRKSGQVNAIPVVPGVTLFEAGDTLTWTPPANTTGITTAFTVVGYDPQNAVIAPALSLSSPAVAVNVDLVDVPPTMTAVDTNLLGNATEDLPFTITYATLLGASNATDANNDQIRFHVTSIQGGTLRISFNGAAPVAVALGTSVLGPNDRLIWTPPLNQNNQLNLNNPLAAFSVVAFDGTNDSSPEIPVLINVNPAQDAPILTKVDTLTLGGKNSRFKITYATLLAASDLQNVDGYDSAGIQVVPGHTKEFRVTAIPTGAKLEIRKAATPTVTTPVVIGTGAGSTIVSVGDVLIWTPPTGVFGDAVPAFSVLGYDGANTAPNDLSALPAVQVTVRVLNEVAPNLTTITTFVRPRFVASTITYQNLVANSDLTFQPGNTVAFRITNIDQGTLLINGAAATVGTLVRPGDVLTWSLLSSTGEQDAFDVEAVDLNNTLVSLDPVQVKVNLVNVAPTLTTLNTLSLADEQTPFDITYATLLANSNAADVNNDALSFRIESVPATGTLTITKNGVTTTAVVGTLVSTGDTLTWTPAAGVTGSAINAFTVKAFDGLLASADPAVQVKINVRPWGSEFSLSGIWTINGKLARIQQSGANLTFVNENGVGSTGKYFARDKVTAVAYGLTATVDITTADQGRLVFSNGVIWLRISLGGSWAVNGKLASIVQSNDVQLTFLNDRNQSSTGAILSATSLIASNYPAGQATFGDGKINFNNGEVWSKLDLSPIYTSSIDGKTVGVVQNGTTTLGFVDQLGNTTSGRWTTPTTVLDVGRNRTGTVSSGKITWAGGEVWNTALSIKGTQSGQPTSKTVTITATGTTMTLTDVNNTQSTVRLNGPNTLFGTSGVFRNIIGQRRGNKVYWTNGLVWENFDFNALNALFTA